MKKILYIGIFILSTVMFTSCVKDLNVTPKDPSTITSANLGSKPEYLQQDLAKIYASFIISGQDNGHPDISASDPNFFTTMRAWWNLQEITTDEAICAWGDVGIASLNTQTWSPSNPFLTALYQRLGLSITYANEYIRNTEGNTDAKVVKYRAEARFLRALAYYWDMDMFGNPPFTTEKDHVGNFFPKQLDPNVTVARKKLFSYIVSELKAIEPDLGDPGFSFPRADKGADWMLLAKVYQNAKVYTGTAQWDSCSYYATKVISSGAYALAKDYRQNFSADNNYPTDPEMIFAWSQDGMHTNGYVGTTFIMESSCDANYLPAETYVGLTTNTNWNGNRARKNFLNVMMDTASVYAYNGGNVDYANDPFFKKCKDSRVFLRVKKSPDIPSPSSSGDYGIGVYKFTALNQDSTKPANYNSAYACTNFPIFRLADAYMMRAEAEYRTGDIADAVKDINVVRERAFGGPSGDITAAQLNDKFLLDELGREFYYEGHRRTDLIRFGQFTNGTYNWVWKGGAKDGIATDSHLNLFPIPGDEVSSNPNIHQNPGY
jgi:hypothetical protein